MEKRTASIAPQQERKYFETKEKSKLKRFSAPVQSSINKEKRVSAHERRPWSSAFPSTPVGTGRPYRQSVFILDEATPGVLEGNGDLAKWSRMGHETVGALQMDGRLVKGSPATGHCSTAATDESGTNSGDRPRSRPLSWTKRISMEFSGSTDLAGKLKSMCSMPSAVSKDAGNMFISTSITCAKACANYWKPPRITDEHHRVASINRRTSSGTPSFSVGSAWSSSSSRSRKSSLSSHTSSDTNETKLNRESIETDRDTLAKAEEDPDVVTIYGIDEFGPPVIAQYLLDS